MNNADVTKKMDTVSPVGFTLVELSIVLVIIGLIVGGVVGGQSLIASAKLNKIVTEHSQYKIAYNAFKLQYDAVPGDFSEGYEYWGAAGLCGGDGGSSHSSCNGNGDGLMNASGAIRSFKHLQLSEIMRGVGIIDYAAGLYDRPCPGGAMQYFGSAT